MYWLFSNSLHVQIQSLFAMIKTSLVHFLNYILSLRVFYKNRFIYQESLKQGKTIKCGSAPFTKIYVMQKRRSWQLQMLKEVYLYT